MAPPTADWLDDHAEAYPQTVPLAAVEDTMREGLTDAVQSGELR